MEAGETVEMTQIGEVPTDVTIALRMTADDQTDEYGLLLRADERGETGYRLRFLPRRPCRFNS